MKHTNGTKFLKAALAVVLCTFAVGCSAAQKTVNTAESLAKGMVDALGDVGREFTKIGEETYMDVYKLDKSKYEDVMVYGSPVNEKAHEMIVIKAKDAANLEEAKKDLEARKAALEEQWKDKLPEQYEMVQKAVIRTKDNYAALIIAPDVQKAQEAFDKSF